MNNETYEYTRLKELVKLLKEKKEPTFIEYCALTGAEILIQREEQDEEMDELPF